LRPQNAILKINYNSVNGSCNRPRGDHNEREKKMTTSSKNKKAKRGGGLEGPSGRSWTMRIEPNGAALLSQTLMPSHFVIKNHGSNNVRLVAHQGDLMDLSPGAVRATYAQGTVTVENRGEKSVLIEFEFLPIFRK
jgi:hypothetical protein